MLGFLCRLFSGCELPKTEQSIATTHADLGQSAAKTEALRELKHMGGGPATQALDRRKRNGDPVKKHLIIGILVLWTNLPEHMPQSLI
jgi:hypothetical protein